MIEPPQTSAAITEPKITGFNSPSPQASHMSDDAGKAEQAGLPGNVALAAAAFARGEPVMVFDSDFREKETDLLWPATAATPAIMRRLRQDCGGLLFLAIGDEIGEIFGLPWLQDIHTHKALVEENPVLGALITDDLQYDTRSAFTLSLNHRDTYTGITDHDRALTTRRFGELAGEMLAADAGNSGAENIGGKIGAAAIIALGAEFRTPGHIPLCREAPGGLSTREGHTELAVAIARLAGVVPCTIGAEMLQQDGDGALPLEDARRYAEQHGVPMLTGADITAALGSKN